MHAQIDSTHTDTLDPSLSFRHDERKWTLGFDFEGALAYRRVSSPTYKELAECRSHHDKPITTINVGLTARYELNRTLELVSGITWFQTGFSFSEDKQLRDSLSPEFLVGCDVYAALDPGHGFVREGFFDPRYVYIVTGPHPKKATLEMKVTYDFLEVPLMLKVNIGHNRTRAFISGGAAIDYLYAMSHTIVLTDHVNYSGRYGTNDIADYYRRWNCSALLSAGVESKLHKNLSVGFHLNGRYQVRSIFGDEFYRNYKEHHFSIAVGGGFYYHFG
jgi:hypothetical protein